MAVLRVVLVIVSLLYPLAIYFGLQHFDARSLVLLLVGLAGLRIVTDSGGNINHWLWIPLFAVLVFWVLLSNSGTGLKLYPVLMNLSLLLIFAWSLRHPPSVIERAARLQEPDLPPRGQRYAAQVTRVWCGFFIINGSIALVTALWMSDQVWALYNGLVAYALMALLFGGEWLVRQRVMRISND